MAAPPTPDWSATQYLKYATERTRPVHDLITYLHPLVRTPSPTIVDLGCGPGNSTSALLSAFPSARVSGLDSSPDMLRKARAALPNVPFAQADVATYTPDPAADVLFSNAVFHWLRSGARLAALTRLLEGAKRGAVLALQVPDNYAQPSHALMRATAGMADQPWTGCFADTRVGDVGDATRPDLDPIEAPGVIYDALRPFAESVTVWRTEYMHVLADAHAIVEWVKGTGLQPFLHRISDSKAKDAFLEEYERRLAEAYPPLADGNVLLGYPRLFIVAVRK